jgi:hypothetical protein
MTDERFNRPAWECVHFASEAPSLPPMRDGFVVGYLEGKECISDTKLFAEVQRVLAFPDYFGHNWDALEECLRDLDGRGKHAYVLVMRNAKLIWAEGPRTAGKFVEVWLSAASFVAKRGVALHLIFEW